MKKIFTTLLFLTFSLGIFALDIQTDLLVGGGFDFLQIKGDSTIYTLTNYGIDDHQADYLYSSKAGSINLGLDTFWGDFPIGAHLNGGFIFSNNAERLFNKKTLELDFPKYCFTVDIGAVYEYDFNDSLSLCTSVNLDIIYLISEGYKGSRYIADSLAGVGPSTELYIKYRHKFLALAAGCKASYYPLSLVTVGDSSCYSSTTDGKFSYHINPYIMIGCTFIESIASTITASN